MKFVRVFILVIILYIYAHAPIILSFGILGRMEYQSSIVLLYIISILFFLSNFGKCSIFFRKVHKELVIFAVICSYVFLRTLFGGDSQQLIDYTKTFLELFLIPAFIIYYIKKSGLNNELDFIRLFLYLGCVGGIISSLCVAFPVIGSYVRDNLLLNMEETVLAKDYRGFGLSSGLTYAYGIIQGVIIALGLAFSKYNKWFFFFIPFMLISIILNARTGMLVAFCGIILLMLETKKSIGNIFVVSSLILAIFLGWENLLAYIGVDEGSMEFIDSFFDEVNIVTSEGVMSGVTTSTLFGDMLIFPSSLSEWIVGRGYYIFGRVGEKNSDIGFILQLNYGGLLYIIPLYYFIFKISLRLYRLGLLKIAVLFVLTFFIANTKGPYLPNTGMFRLLILISFYYFVNIEKKSNASIIH